MNLSKMLNWQPWYGRKTPSIFSWSIGSKFKQTQNHSVPFCKVYDSHILFFSCDQWTNLPKISLNLSSFSEEPLNNFQMPLSLIRGHSRQELSLWGDMLRDQAEAPAEPQILSRCGPRFQTIRQLSQVFWGNNSVIRILRLSSDMYREWQSKAFSEHRTNILSPVIAVQFSFGRGWSGYCFRTWERKGRYSAQPRALYSELMCCGHGRALWEDQESISRIGGQAWPRGPEPRTVCGRPPRCVSQVRSKGGGAKWNANAGHISQGSLIGTQLLQGPGIPRSASQKQRNQQVTMIRSSFSPSPNARPEKAGAILGKRCRELWNIKKFNWPRKFPSTPYMFIYHAERLKRTGPFVIFIFILWLNGPLDMAASNQGGCWFKSRAWRLSVWSLLWLLFSSQSPKHAYEASWKL